MRAEQTNREKVAPERLRWKPDRKKRRKAEEEGGGSKYRGVEMSSFNTEYQKLRCPRSVP